MSVEQVDKQRVAYNIKVHDLLVDRYDKSHTEIFNDREQSRLVEALKNAIGEIRSAAGTVEALDMGCGSGNLTRHLLDLGCRVTATDVSPKFLALVQQRFGGERLATSRLNGTDMAQFADCSFDLIATYSVLHHIPDYVAAVREMGRICRPGGIVYIDHESPEHVWNGNEAYADFKRRASRPNLAKWLRPMNYYGKFRRLFDPKFANEGDIHVWPDDHIEWSRIADALGDDFEVVVDREYLLFDGRYRPEVYDEHVGRLTDMKVVAFRRKA